LKTKKNRRRITNADGPHDILIAGLNCNKTTFRVTETKPRIQHETTRSVFTFLDTRIKPPNSGLLAFSRLSEDRWAIYFTTLDSLIGRAGSRSQRWKTKSGSYSTTSMEEVSRIRFPVPHFHNRNYNKRKAAHETKHTEGRGVVVTESKIAATHRLQKSGRWEEASEYRAEQRQKFRAQRFTKKEANEKSWEAMILKFPPPPNEDTANYFESESALPRFYLDHKSASFFSVYCKIRAELYRHCPVEMKQADKPTTERRLEPQTALPLGSTERTDDLLKFAFEHPVDFLGHCGEVLEETVDELSDDTGDSLEDILPEFVASIPMMQRIVQKRFAGALCP
jgi:hypothetical protein